MDASDGNEGLFLEAFDKAIAASSPLLIPSEHCGTSDVVPAAKQDNGADRALALALSTEQALLSAEADAASVQLALSTVESETVAMEAYRSEAEALHTAVDNAKTNTKDIDTATQAQQYALVASASATKSLALKQRTQSTENVKASTNSARETAEKVRLASVHAAEAKLGIRNFVPEEAATDLVERVDACAERILQLHESTQQTLRTITQRCSQALAARTQGDTAVMRTLRASKEAARKPATSRDGMENFQSKSPKAIMGSRTNIRQTGQAVQVHAGAGEDLSKKTSTQELPVDRTTEVNRAARTAAALLRAQRNAARAQTLEPVVLNKSNEAAAKVQAVLAENVLVPTEEQVSVEDLSGKTDSSTSPVEVCTLSEVDVPKSGAETSELQADSELRIVCELHPATEDPYQTADDASPAVPEARELTLDVESPIEVSMQEEPVVPLVTQHGECAEERAQDIFLWSFIDPEREQDVLEHSSTIAVESESELQPQSLFAVDAPVLDPPQSLQASSGDAAAVCVAEPQEGLNSPLDDAVERLDFMTERVVSPPAPAEELEIEICAALEAVVLAVETNDSGVAITSIAECSTPHASPEDTPLQESMEPAGEVAVIRAAQEDPLQLDTSVLTRDAYDVVSEKSSHDCERASVLAVSSPNSTAEVKENHVSSSCLPENSHAAGLGAQQEEIDVLLEVARLAEEEAQQWLVATEVLVRSAEDMLVSAEEAAHMVDEADALAQQELVTFTEYRTSVGNSFAAVNDALHATSKEARLCEEDFQTIKLQIQTADDALMAEHTSIEEELSLLSKPVLLDDSDAARRVWNRENASMLQKIADKMDSMLVAECKREEIAREHVKYVHDRLCATAAGAQATLANDQALAASHMKNSLTVSESTGKLGQMVDEAFEKVHAVAVRISVVQAELRDALANADLALETFKEASASLEAGMNGCDAADGIGRDFNRDALKFLTQHTQRRLNVAQRMEETVEKVHALEKHAHQLSQKVATACDEALAAKKEGDALAMRCVMSSAKASALASDAPQRRLNVAQRMEETVEKVHALEKHAHQLSQKVATACDEALAAKKEGDALAMRCVMSSAKASALASDARNTKEKMVANAKTALLRAQNYVKTSREMCEKSRASAVDAEGARLAAESAFEGSHSPSRRRDHVSPRKGEFDLHRSTSDSRLSSYDDSCVHTPTMNLKRENAQVSPRSMPITSPPQSARTPNFSSPPRSAHRRTVSSPPHSSHLTSAASSPRFSGFPSDNSPLHSSRLSDVSEAPSPLLRNSADNRTKMAPPELERVDASAEPSAMLPPGRKSPPQSARTPNFSSPPRSAHRRTVSSPPHSSQLTSAASPPRFPGFPSDTSPRHSSRLSDMPEPPSPLLRNSADNRTKTAPPELERIEALCRTIRDAATRAEEWTMAAERIAHGLHQTVHSAHIAADSAHEAAGFVSRKFDTAKKHLLQVEELNTSAFDGFYAASVEMNACEETKRAFIKRINIADGVLEDKRASIEEEIYLLETTSPVRDVATRRAKLMSQVHSAMIRREKQAVEHVDAARSSTSAGNAQNHADRAAFCASEVVRLQPHENNVEQFTRARLSSTNAAEQVSAASQEAVQRNQEVRVALEETRKACDFARHVAADLQFWEAECDKLGINYSRGEMQELKSMPWFAQRSSQAARQVEEMAHRLLMMRAQTQDTSAQVVEHVQQIHSIRSETELAVSRVFDAAREASEVAQRARQVESQMVADADAALVRARNETAAIRETVQESDHSPSGMQRELSSSTLSSSMESWHRSQSAHPQTRTNLEVTTVKHHLFNAEEEELFPSSAEKHPVISARLCEWEESCQAYFNRVQRADDAFTAVQVSIEKELASLKENERVVEAQWRSENSSESVRDAQRASFAQQRAGLQACLAAAATIREDKISDVLAQAQEQQLEFAEIQRDCVATFTPRLERGVDFAGPHDNRERVAADIDRVRRMEVTMLATVEAAFRRAQDVSSSFKRIVSCY
eukprot:CAMPEP_0185014326 /NCGR_PEP_ID=MMETSP1098-20130426/99257_1 /TAXON_ID=89044 /ORGANISM="Spumella elongata, Strain CCAP 955/1" /LENGTH=1998 /DNA_ID=CAMNT_0027543415 /DNA_START=163 /DNA_END=6159 /DNA_ORIENTATION=-